MVMKAIVDGLEILGRGATVLQCDKCKAIFDIDVNFSGIDKLRKSARNAGWTGEMEKDSENDLCPKCFQSQAPQEDE